jgi:hypothetical protein
MKIGDLQQLESLFAAHAVSQLYIKKLAPKQDNEKNQIYLGKGLDGIGNLFPSEVIERSASESTGKRKSSPGREPLVVYAGAGPSSLGWRGAQEAWKYFSEPNCKRD